MGLTNNISATERHYRETPCDALDENVLDRGEGEGQVARHHLEEAEAQERGRHSHGAHPTRLQAKVHCSTRNQRLLAG